MRIKLNLTEGEIGEGKMGVGKKGLDKKGIALLFARETLSQLSSRYWFCLN